MLKVVSYRVVLLGYLLLYTGVAANGREEDSLGEVGEGCPCLTFEKAALIEEYTNATKTQLENEDLDPNTFGVGCEEHRNTSGSIFCYVDPRNCDVEFKKSEYRSKVAWSSHTCGYVNVFSRAKERMDGKKLKVVIDENHRGWQGTICPYENNTNNEQCHGTVIDLKRLMEGGEFGNFSFEVTTIPHWVEERAELYPPFVENGENMQHGACVYATSVGVVDLCLGAFTKNTHRTQISSFLVMGVTSEYVIINDEAVGLKGDTFGPFTNTLWVTTFVVLIILSVLFVLQEHSWSELRELPLEKSIGLAVYHAFLNFFDGGHEQEGDATTWGGRITLLAIAVQVLMAGASYTANLTTFLVQKNLANDIQSIDGVIANGFEVCALRNRISMLNIAFGERLKFAVGDDGKIGFENRTNILPAFDRGSCSVAILDELQLNEYHGDGMYCEKKFVGPPVVSVPWGIPVSEEFALPMKTVISEIILTGGWQKIQNDERPENICRDDQIDAEVDQLGPEHMKGAYYASGVLAALGIVFSLVRLARKKKKATSPKSKKNPEHSANTNDALVISTSMDTMKDEILALNQQITDLRQTEILAINEKIADLQENFVF